MEKYRELLERILEIQSKSKEEKRMKRFVRSYLKKLGLNPEGDDKGNIYCHKGDKRRKRPFVVAHLDTVHAIRKHVSLYYNSDYGYYFAMDNQSMEQRGVGGDDKVGVWAALAAITEFDNISIALFVQEEIGCLGSNAADMKQFARANWLAQLDRRGFEDFITYNMASKEFVADMLPLVEKHGMKVKTHSTITDVATLYRRKVGVSSVNISSGYYAPHTSEEVVIWDDAANAMNLLFAMVTEKGKNKYTHLPPVHKPKENLPATQSSKTRGTKVKGFSGGSEDSKRGRVAYVAGKMRIWNGWHGCYEWRDYSGNFMYYEGIYDLAQHYSKSLKIISLPNAKEPVYQEPIPYNDVIHDDHNTYSNLDIFGETVNVDDFQKEFDFDKHADGPGFSETETDEEYWNRMAKEAEIRDRFDRTVGDVEANEKFDDKEMELKTYHDFEEKYVNNSEMTKARNQLDAILHLYGCTFIQFIQGKLSADVIKNISSSLHYDHGNTLSHYSAMFGIAGTYPDDDTNGVWTSFSGKTIHSDHCPY